MDFDTLLRWWQDLPPLKALQVYLGFSALCGAASFLYRLHKGRGFGSALLWGLWEGVTWFVPSIYFMGAAIRDRQDMLSKRRKRRTGSLTDEF